MTLLPPKKYQEGGKEHTWPKKGTRNPKGRRRPTSLLYFSYSVPKSRLFFASNRSHAHRFLPVPSLIRALLTAQLPARVPMFRWQNSSRSTLSFSSPGMPSLLNAIHVVGTPPWSLPPSCAPAPFSRLLHHLHYCMRNI